MLNQVILVGRIKEKHEGKINVAIPRDYKNENGEYDTDLVTVLVKGKLNDSVQDYCSIGDLVGIRGKVSTEKDNLIIKAEKVTFLSTSKKD